jgi:hypothetical protein
MGRENENKFDSRFALKLVFFFFLKKKKKKKKKLMG